MNKDELLQELSVKVGAGEISREELINLFGVPSAVGGSVIAETQDTSSSFSVTKMLYILGAAIVVIGIIALVSQIWDAIGSIGRVSVTLGLGLLVTAIGSMLLGSRPEDNIGPVFYAIGGLLIPGGAMVTLSELNIGNSSLWPVTITFGILFVFYLLLNLVQKNAVLTLFAIVNGTTFVYLIVTTIVRESLNGYSGDIYTYLTMMIGATYLLLGHAFYDGWNKKLVGSLNFFGSIFLLGASFSKVFDSVLWQMLYFIIIAGGFSLSVYMRSKSILVMSTIFLIAHISYITGEYFADSIGWPFSLVILGFMFIGLGFVSVNINKKYISN